jgi:hypothetical protein
MRSLKHIGKIKNTGVKVLVVFRTLPGEANTALVLPTSTLPDAYHDAIMQLVETDQAQDAFEFGEIMHIRPFPDGRPMLRAMQADNRLQKVATDTVIMTPSPNTEIQLDQLNVLIAEQKNCAIDDLCNFVSGGSSTSVPAQQAPTVAETKTEEAPARAQAPQDGVLSDLDIAKSYRSQADAMYKEAARLRKQADELDPPKKKSAKVAESASA